MQADYGYVFEEPGLKFIYRYTVSFSDPCVV